MLEGAIATLDEKPAIRRDSVVWIPVFLAAGIGIYFYLPKEPPFWAGVIALGVGGLVAIAALIAAQKSHRDWVTRGAYIALIVFTVVLGFTAAQLRTHLVASPLLNKMISAAMVQGRVVDITIADDDEDKKAKRKVTLDALSIDRLTPENTPKTIRLTTYHIPADVVPGDRIQVLARLMPPSGAVLPGGYDYRRQAYFDQTGAVGFTLGKYQLLEKGVPAGVEEWFSKLRLHISSIIATHMQAPESAVATALLAGERASIPKPIIQDLTDSGLLHILSISGLHVAIVCGVVFFTLRFLMALWPWFALHHPIKKYAALAALAVGIFYTLLAGAPVPTQRSMVMTGLVLMAVLLDRSALSMRVIALAAIGVLLVQPESLVGASFQLSFAAVLAMIAFHEGWGRRLMITSKDQGHARKALIYMGGIVVTTILVSLATAPVVLHHFGRFQLYGVLGNAAAIPLTSFVVMPFGMAALLVMPLGWEGPFLAVTEWGVRQMLNIAHWVAHLPSAAMALPGQPLWAFVASSCGFIFLCLWRGPARWAGLAIMVICIVLGLYASKPDILINHEAKGFAVHNAGQTAYALDRPDAYTRRHWLGFWGGQEINGGKVMKGDSWTIGSLSVACDDHACRVQKGDARLSVIRNPIAWGEECAWARTIISLHKGIDKVEQEQCKATLITFWDIVDMQGVALHEKAGQWHIEPVQGLDENRPWAMRF